MTEDRPPKAVDGKFAGVGAGVLLAGGAVLGCFALALWNRKALTAMVKNRGQRHESVEEVDPANDPDAIY